MGHSRQLKGGYLLMLVVGLVGVLFSLGLAVVHFMTAHRQLVRKAEDTALAREAARSGVELAIAELRQDPDWRAGFEARQLVPETLADLSLTEAPEGVHLVCQARAPRAEARYEAIVHLPREVLHNDFSASAGEWEQPNGLPVALLGYYLLNLGLPGDVYAGDEAWSDYEAEFEVLLGQATSLGLLVRVSPRGAYLVDYSLLRGDIQLAKLEGNSSTVLAMAPRRDLQLPHTFTIRAEGGDLSVKLDGQQVLQYRDPQPLRQGRIGIRPLLGVVTLVDEVSVRSLLQVVSRWRP